MAKLQLSSRMRLFNEFIIVELNMHFPGLDELFDPIMKQYVLSHVVTMDSLLVIIKLHTKKYIIEQKCANLYTVVK